MKVTIEVEFEINDSWMPKSPDYDATKWFWESVMPTAHICLWSNEVGDEIASNHDFLIKKVRL